MGYARYVDGLYEVHPATSETSPDSLVLLAKPLAPLVEELKWLRNQIP
jgi:hypothetical protein